MLNSFLLAAFALSLNVVHIFVTANVFNKEFNPVLGVLSFGIFTALVFFTSSLKKDSHFIFLIGASLVSQIGSFYLNGGKVPDYINLGLFNANIPDFIISITILTWWYQRVYKQPKVKPAELRQND